MMPWHQHRRSAFLSFLCRCCAAVGRGCRRAARWLLALILLAFLGLCIWLAVLGVVYVQCRP